MAAKTNTCWMGALRAWLGAAALLFAGGMPDLAIAQDIGVMCALPHDHGAPGSDCTGKHTIVFSTTGTSGAAKVTAEIQALDASGELIRALPVKNGDSVHLASRVAASDFKMQTKKPGEHEVFAPLPLLKVTVEDGGQKAEAYCSNIPYLEVVQPQGAVVSESSGNDTKVVVAIPRTDPATVALTVDNVNLFAALGVSPLSCTASAPCSGIADVNGSLVAVSNLIVDGSIAIGVQASNTVRATLSGLTCGTHLFTAAAAKAPGALSSSPSSACLIDDLADTGTSSVFAIQIDSPLEGSVVAAGSVLVEGQVCGGHPIVNAKLNGANLNLAGQVFTAGNGVDAGDLYVLPIHAALGETDLVRDISTGDAPIGTVDPGSNRLAAAATDDLGNRAYARRIFAAGDVAPIGIDQALSATFQQQALSLTIQDQLKQLVAPQVQLAMDATSTDIQNAFIVGLSANGTQKLFDELCTSPINAPDNPAINGKTPGQVFKERVEAAILDIDPVVRSVPSPCSCDPDVSMHITGANVGTSVTCPVTFTDGKFSVQINLPDIHVDAAADGECGGYGDDICFEGIGIHMTATADITGVHLTYDVTEENLLNDTTSPSAFVSGTTATAVQGEPDLCGVSEVCDVLVTIFTFGAIDVTPEIDFSKVQDFSQQLGDNQPDPVHLKEIKVDEEVVANFDQKLSGDVSSVNITSHGIVAGLVGHFATTVVDSEVPSMPGAVLTPAPVPTLPVPNAQDVFIGLADDSINMMFASMAAAGKLKLGCVDTTKTIGDLLPDCDSLTLETDAATAAARGMCHGVRGNSCEAVSFGTALLTATAQGICHGVQGDTCSSIPTALGTAIVERAACNATPDFNLHGDQSLLFCTQADVPPRMMFPGGNTLTSSVPAAMRVNDLSVALVVDRDGTPGFPPPGGLLADAQGCFKQDGNTSADCNLLAACLDINLNFNVGFQTCSDGKPGFRSSFSSIQVLNREVGMVCGGAGTPTDDDLVLDQTSSDDTVTIQLGQQAGQLSPDICGAGLTLGGFVTCDSPQLLAIEADGSSQLKDYLAITCNVN